MFDDLLWDDVDWDFHIFFAVHDGVQVKIFDVDAHELCTGCGDDDVPEDLCCDEASYVGADVIWVINKVTSDCASNSSDLGFLGVVICD